jgi:hypothetical protein
MFPPAQLFKMFFKCHKFVVVVGIITQEEFIVSERWSDLFQVTQLGAE